MSSMFLMYFGLGGFALSLSIAVILWFHGQGVHPFDEVMVRFRRLPRLAQIALLLFVVNLIVYGSTKAPTNAPPPLLTLPRYHSAETNRTAYGFTEEQSASGFALVEVGANEVWDFAVPTGMTTMAAWRLRGAAEDWFSLPFPDLPLVVCTDGRIRIPSDGQGLELVPFGAPLSLVPECNWSRLVESDAPSVVWYGTNRLGRALVTWQNAFIGRDTNLPVSVQVEFRPGGSFIYRYDFSRLDPFAVTNFQIGAFGNGRGESVDWTVCSPTNLTSVRWYALHPSDYETSDRDGDGVDTADEVFLYGTNPGAYDTDFDGRSDGEEVNVLNPRNRDTDGDGLVDGADPNPGSFDQIEDSDEDGIPDIYENYWFGSCGTCGDVNERTDTGFTVGGLLRSGLNPNEPVVATVVSNGTLVSWRLWNRFAADWTGMPTNLVFERTIRLGESDGWQQYYISAAADKAAGWRLGGMTLEWEDDKGLRGTTSLSPSGDSLYLPIATNLSRTVTIRLRATGSHVISPTPIYLVGYAPTIGLINGAVYDSGDGYRATVYVGGSSAEIPVRVDRSLRPCKAALYEGETAMPGYDDMSDRTGGRMRYEGGLDAGRIVVERPGVFALPVSSISGEPSAPLRAGRNGLLGAGQGGNWLLILDPSIWYGEGRCFSRDGLGYDWVFGNYSITTCYPLDTECLWRKWQMDSSGAEQCGCIPGMTAGIDISGYDFIEMSLHDIGSEAVGQILVDGTEIWSATAEHKGHFEGGGNGSGYLGGKDECDECENLCADGNCDDLETPSAGSVKFRIPVGSPRKGQVSGFAYFWSEGPFRITPATFDYLIRRDSLTTVTTNGMERQVHCSDLHGRDILFEPMPNGVRATVRTVDPDELEHVWEIVNPEGDTNALHFVKISRLANAMGEWSFRYANGRWVATDDVSGIEETVTKGNGLNASGDGVVREIRVRRDASGLQLERTVSESRRIGDCDNAVLRETYFERATGTNLRWRRADYWDDASHRARHGLPRSVRGNDTPWEYHDYDENGYEILRVEQRNGSAFPQSFPFVSEYGDLQGAGGLADATVTVFGYDPDGWLYDDWNEDDNGRVRREVKYVVRNGVATEVSRIWYAYTHDTHDGYPTVREEICRAGYVCANGYNADNARSYRVFFSESAAGVPLVLRGETAEEMDEDGVLTVHAFSTNDVMLVDEAHVFFGDVERPTYSVTERDLAYGNVLRTAECLTVDSTPVSEELNTYDEQNRLRSTTYLDGTSVTNSYSCCRKLWSRDRQGRKTLRSAVTGEDRLYYADEEVWLRAVATNGGHKVTQHFFDGLGRETNTVVYVAASEGEATNRTMTSGRGLPSERTLYPDGGDDRVVSISTRGRMSERRVTVYEDREETYEVEYAADGVNTTGVRTVTVDYRNGDSITEKSWDGKWTREIRRSDYDTNGYRIEYEITESSDYGTVTNRVTHSDFLGRTVLTETPLGSTATAYDGATSRAVASTFTADGVTQVTTSIYNDWGESVGSVRDGVTSRDDVVYEMDDDGAWWKVTRQTVVGSETNSVAESREQLTDRVEGLKSRRIDISAEGVATETREVFDAATGESTTVTSNAIAGVTTRVARYGVALETTTPEETTTSTYDSLGQCIGRARAPAAPQASQSDLALVRAFEIYTYDNLGDLVAQTTFTNGTEGITETYVYDTFGRRISTVNALGDETTTEYDAAGNVIETAGATYPVKYEYDTAGRRTVMRTTQDGSTWDETRWTYDPQAGKCLSKRYADGTEATTTYTVDGLPAITTLPSGQWKSCEYDAQRRLVGQTSNDGREDASFAYDEFSRMIAASNGVAQIGYELHRGGIATNEVIVIGANAYEITRSLDPYGRLVGRSSTVLSPPSATAPATSPISIAYTAANRVESVASAAVGVTYLYTADGQDAGYLLTTGGTTVRREVTRDAYRRALVTSVSNFVNGVAIDTTTYTHDALSRMTGRARCPQRAATDDPSDRVCETFGYNEKGEVTYASINGWETAYDYDQIGSFLEVTQGTNSAIYAANALNQYTAAGDAALSYTADGGLTGFGGLTFAYDSGTRLTSVSSNGVVIATYDYDAFDRRVRKVTPEAETTFVYDGWNLVLEEVSHTNGAVDRIEYVWGKDLSGTLDGAGGVGGLLYLKHNGAIYIPLYDANGSVIGYLDAAGNLVATFAYDAFGNELPSTNNQSPTTNNQSLFRFRYSTKYLDPETGHYYYGYRFYSPVLARWLTRDPIEEQGGINLYAFCGNNGVNGYDARGLSEADVRLILNQIAPFFRALNCPIAATMFSFAYGLKEQPPLDEAHSQLSSLMPVVAQAVKASHAYAKVMQDFMKGIQTKWKHDNWTDIPGISFMIWPIKNCIVDILMANVFARNGRRIDIITKNNKHIEGGYDEGGRFARGSWARH